MERPFARLRKICKHRRCQTYHVWFRLPDSRDSDGAFPEGATHREGEAPAELSYQRWLSVVKQELACGSDCLVQSLVPWKPLGLCGIGDLAAPRERRPPD